MPLGVLNCEGPAVGAEAGFGPGDTTAGVTLTPGSAWTTIAAGAQGKGLRATGGVNAYVDFSGPASAKWRMRQYWLNIGDTISGDLRILIANNTSGTRAASLSYHKSLNAFALYDSTSTSTRKWQSTALSPGWYCVEMRGDRVAGTLTVAYRRLGDAADIQAVTTTGCNLTALDVNMLKMGKGTAAVTPDLDFDAFAFEIGDDSPIGPYVPPVAPPTINVASKEGLFELNVRGSVSGGGPLAYELLGVTPWLEIQPGHWLIAQTDTAQQVTVRVTQDGVGYTRNVTVPSRPIAGDTIYLPPWLMLQNDGTLA